MRRRLELPSAADPVVTAVVVVHGRHDLARRTLESLAATVEADIEVVVVDNDSPDGAGRRLAEETEGATILLERRNLGFGAGVNLGALHARGRYLAVLNSDLAFEGPWLEPLLDAIEDDPTAGAAVPMYLDVDGRVDAGQLIGADGRGYPYGDRASPGDAEVTFTRRVDYGGAAALVVRRDAFDAAGGFDPAYGLGYYEDADLGFSMRAAGFDTLYVPAAVVRHIGGGSFDRAARDRQLARNRPLFVERFGPALAGRPRISRPPYDPHRELVLRDWCAGDRLLVVDRGHALASFAAEARSCFPRSLVTWVSDTSPPPAAAPRAAQVEWCGAVRDPARWLEDRRFHYTAVVVHADVPTDLQAAVGRTQPQARRGTNAPAGAPGSGVVAVPVRPDVELVLRQLGFAGPSRRR